MCVFRLSLCVCVCVCSCAGCQVLSRASMHCGSSPVLSNCPHCTSLLFLQVVRLTTLQESKEGIGLSLFLAGFIPDLLLTTCVLVHVKVLTLQREALRCDCFSVCVPLLACPTVRGLQGTVNVVLPDPMSMEDPDRRTINPISLSPAKR